MNTNKNIPIIWSNFIDGIYDGNMDTIITNKPPNTKYSEYIDEIPKCELQCMIPNLTYVYDEEYTKYIANQISKKHTLYDTLQIIAYKSNTDYIIYINLHSDIYNIIAMCYHNSTQVRIVGADDSHPFVITESFSYSNSDGSSLLGDGTPTFNDDIPNVNKDAVYFDLTNKDFPNFLKDKLTKYFFEYLKDNMH